jgi:cytochrome c biogenesis protein CcmG/thiol:disulfide interchange protein DsbE
MSRLLRFAPLIVLVLVVAAMIWRLATPADTTVASKLEGKEVPDFALPAALPSKGSLSAQDLAAGQPRLVNIFASWCVPCISEVKVLKALQERGVTIDGIAIRDTPEALSDFLKRYGDPYSRIGSDQQSAVQIAFGSAGVPESFVVDGRGIIRYQHIGAIEEADVPMIMRELEEAR